MKLLDFIVYRARHSAAIAGISSAILLTTLFCVSGAFQPRDLPEYYTSPEQLLGTVMLIIVISAVLLVFLILGQRRSMRYGQELFDRGVSDQRPESWLRPMKIRVPLIGAGLGLFYALIANTPLLWIADFVHSNSLTQSIVIGQAVLWTLVGLTLSYRLHTAFAYNKLGRTIRLDLLDVHQIAPFAKSGVDDVLVIAIMLALSTMQSLDAQFRVYNYAASMLVALPAAGLLFFLPMLSVHRRLLQAKTEYLKKMDTQIASASRTFTTEAVHKLELLMQHRDRVRDTLTWPLDWTIYSRLAFYVILPPIAWLGAAFVEFGVDRMLADP